MACVVVSSFQGHTGGDDPLSLSLFLHPRHYFISVVEFRDSDVISSNIDMLLL